MNQTAVRTNIDNGTVEERRTFVSGDSLLLHFTNIMTQATAERAPSPENFNSFLSSTI
jgi:hypothetical protein